MQLLTQILKQINDYVWGLPLICLLLGTGIYFTFKLRLIQLTKLKLAFKCIFKKQEGDGDVSSFQALCTALSSTIGTGNIVGVATAIAAGGPGALFWMWISAFFGMATKYAEGLLAIRYRQKDENGEIAGGPMYYLEKGLHSPLLAKIFAFFGVSVALLGIGTFTQVKSISSNNCSCFYYYWRNQKNCFRGRKSYSTNVCVIHWRGRFNTCVTYYPITKCHCFNY